MLEKLLAAVRRRKPDVKAARVGDANLFLRKMAETYGGGNEDAGVAEVAAACGVTAAVVKAAIAGKSGQLTWYDPQTADPVFRAVKSGDAVSVNGDPTDGQKDGYQLTDGSIMDFDCVVTTGRRDRDGDVLDPKGAILDLKMPLLWQHLPFSPVGRLVRQTGQSETGVSGRFMIAGTALGNDAAVLVDAGCLRISHGFAPIEYAPLKDDNGKDMGGWNITKYAMMETSLVSIPSNVDAEITQFSRGKLHTPLMKAFYGKLFEGRKTVVKGGFDPAAGGGTPAVNVTVNLNGIGQKRAKVKAEDDDEEDDEEGDTDTEDGADDEAGVGDPDPSEDESDTDVDGTDDGDGDSEESAGKALGDIISQVKELAGTEGLSREAGGRLNIVQGMFEDIEDNIGASADAISEAAKSRDLAGMYTAMAELTTNCVKYLQRANDEMKRVMDLDDLPDAVRSVIEEVAGDADRIVAAVGAMSGAAGDAVADQDDPDADGDDDSQADALNDQDPEGDAAMGDDDDDADSEDDDDDQPDGKAEDDDDVEDKTSDDEEDGENPEADLTGSANPGVNPRSADRRRLADVLGSILSGGKATPAERKLARRHLGELAG